MELTGGTWENLYEVGPGIISINAKFNVDIHHSITLFFCAI